MVRGAKRCVAVSVNTDHDRAGVGPTLYTASIRCVALQALASGVGAKLDTCYLDTTPKEAVLASSNTAVQQRCLAVRIGVHTDHDRAGGGPALYTASKR